MTRSIRDLVPAYIHEIEPYRPGKPVEEVEREYHIHAIKLASNENPLGPSPLAVAAVQTCLKDGNRYPDGGGYYLREKLAARHNVKVDQILLTLGSSEMIDLAARALLRPGEEGLVAANSYPPYSSCIRATGAKLVCVPTRDYRYDLAAIAEAICPRTRIVFLANPDNPTGTYFTADDFEKFLTRVPQDTLVVLDEAYYHYVERPDYSRSLEQLKRYPNLLVLRTFSKIYGLAGLRIGYGIGAADFLAELNKLRTPFNTSGPAQAAALAALDDAEHVRRSVESNRAGQEQLRQGLRGLGVLSVPSVTNFVFVEVGRDGGAVSVELLKLGVIVRPMGWMGYPQAIRVTVGTREENEKFLAAFAQVRSRTGLSSARK